MTKLSNNFTLEELIKSDTAKKYKIDNKPNKDTILKLERLAKEILQPIRDKFGQPIVVTSGYRSLLLNKKVGGASTSQHVKGEAADIRTKSDKPEDNKKLFDLIVNMIKDKQIVVGQLLDEFNYNWVHVSLPTSKHKNEVLHIKK